MEHRRRRAACAAATPLLPTLSASLSAHKQRPRPSSSRLQRRTNVFNRATDMATLETTERAAPAGATSSSDSSSSPSTSSSSTSASDDTTLSLTYDDSVEITTRPVDPDTRSRALADYAALKERISGRGRRFGAGLALYLLLTLSGESALACLVGAAASALYLLWLFRDADALGEDSTVPVMAARQVEGAIPRGIAMTLAGLATGLSPRLLVPIALGAGAWGLGKLNGEPLPLAVDGGLILGFLSHKAGLVLEVWDELKPKVDPDAGLKKERPRMDLPEVEDWRAVFERERKEKEEKEREENKA